MGEELQSKKIGIIGRAGRIGNEVSRILTVGFQAYVLGYDVIRPRGVPGLSYEITDSIEDLLQRCDIVTIHVPYSPQTHYLLNESRLRMMRKGSYLVNTSRGDIVEGPALLKLLKEGQIGGASLDVFHLEPPVDEWEKELVNLPRLRNERALRSQKGSRPRVSGSNRRPESAGLEFVQRKPLPTFRVEKITHSIWKNRTELARIGDRGGGFDMVLRGCRAIVQAVCVLPSSYG